MKHYVLPVIHHLDAKTSVEQADLAMRCGADGVFLISHDGKNSELYLPATVIRARHPGAKVGLNLLGLSAMDAIQQASFDSIEVVWVDNAGVTSQGPDSQALRIGEWLRSRPDFELFGSIAFKYQAHEPDAATAGLVARQLGMVPTTSGTATGSAPSVEKLASMRAAIGLEAPLAVASGMTPENVGAFLPYVTHFLVATGVSSDMHHFDEALLRKFVTLVRLG